MNSNELLMNSNKKASTKRSFTYIQPSRVVTPILRLVFKLFNSGLASLSRRWDKALPIMRGLGDR